MKNTPLVSVIIPVHNGEKFVGICLNAVFASSYSPIEVIVVDDCSTDDTVELVRQKGVTAYQLPVKSGPAAARNYGAGCAQGEILLFIDCDVEVRKETIASVLRFLLNFGDFSRFFHYHGSS